MTDPNGPAGRRPGPDVVEHGPERPRRRSRGAAVGLAAAVVLGAIAVNATRDRDPAPDARPSPTARPVDAPLKTFTPPETPAPPSPLRGPVATGLAGRVVVVAGGSASVVNLATGAATPLPGVGSPVSHAVRVGTSVVLYGGESTGDFPPLTAPVWVVAPEGTVRRIGEAGAVVADAEGRGIWATTWSVEDNTGVVEHLRLDGRRTGGRLEIEGEQVVDGAVRGGLVVRSVADHGIELWNPDGDQRVHREPDAEFTVSSPGRLGWWFGQCVNPCSVRWNDVPGDFKRTGADCRCGGFLLPGQPQAAAMSPDGAWVAVVTEHERYELSVCDLAAEACRRPSNAFSQEPLGLAWTGDGTTLLVAAPAKVAQLAVWRPGWPTVRLVPGRHAAESLAALGT